MIGGKKKKPECEMPDEGRISPLTCLRVLTLSWMGLGKPTRVSMSLENNENNYTRLKEANGKRVACGLRWNTYFPRVKPMNLFLLVSRKCSMSFSLHRHRQAVVTFGIDLRGPSPAATIPHIKGLADSHSTRAHTHTSKHKSPACCISFLQSRQ